MKCAQSSNNYCVVCISIVFHCMTCWTLLSSPLQCGEDSSSPDKNMWKRGNGDAGRCGIQPPCLTVKSANKSSILPTGDAMWALAMPQQQYQATGKYPVRVRLHSSAQTLCLQRIQRIWKQCGSTMQKSKRSQADEKNGEQKHHNGNIISKYVTLCNYSPY